MQNEGHIFDFEFSTVFFLSPHFKANAKIPKKKYENSILYILENFYFWRRKIESKCDGCVIFQNVKKFSKTNF